MILVTIIAKRSTMPLVKNEIASKVNVIENNDSFLPNQGLCVLGTLQDIPCRSALMRYVTNCYTQDDLVKTMCRVIHDCADLEIENHDIYILVSKISRDESGGYVECIEITKNDKIRVKFNKNAIDEKVKTHKNGHNGLLEYAEIETAEFWQNNEQLSNM